MSLLAGSPHELWGLDIFDVGFRQEKFTFIQGDAENIDFPDKFFDVVISIGVLEHIVPIEKLAKVISEIERVSKAYCIVVPSISTIVEPHVWQVFWQLKSMRSPKLSGLNYFSDEAWLSFKGFIDGGAKVRRAYYLPPLISNLFIYKAK